MFLTHDSTQEPRDTQRKAPAGGKTFLAHTHSEHQSLPTNVLHAFKCIMFFLFFYSIAVNTDFNKGLADGRVCHRSHLPILTQIGEQRQLCQFFLKDTAVHKEVSSGKPFKKSRAG